MAIDYFVQFPCKVREQVTDDQLLAMIKSRNRAMVVLEMMRKDPGRFSGRPESEWTVKLMVRRPDGIQEQELNIHEQLAQSAPLDALSPHCIGCPANVRGEAFGCGGAINYPISGQAEDWLLARLPDDIGGPAGTLLMQLIAKLKIDGAPVDAARKRDDLYVRKDATTRKWGSFFSRKTIRSSQALHMLIGVESMAPAYARVMALVFGFLSDKLERVESPANAPAASDDGIVAAFKQFLSAAAVAGSANVALLIDA